MAKKRRPVKPVEPQSESGEEENKGLSEEETQTAMQKKSVKSQQATQTPPPPPPRHPSSEEEESGSESEPEPKPKPMEKGQKSGYQATQTPPPPPPHPSSEEEESESESEPEPKPKPMEKGQKSDYGGKKSRSKLNPEPATPTAAKRSVEDTVSKDAKKRKTAGAETSEKKPNRFQRLWSEEDEIVLLKGMLDYSTKNKSDPIADLDAFHECIRKNLHIDFSRAQLLDKIRKLKKKFKNNMVKERTFSTPHEQLAYDLSKEIWPIWGNEVDKANASAVEKTVLPNSGIEGETDLKKLKVVEVELYIKELEVRAAKAKLILGAMKREYN